VEVILLIAYSKSNGPEPQTRFLRDVLRSHAEKRVGALTQNESAPPTHKKEERKYGATISKLKGLKRCANRRD
jgi:hypothetical protein